MLADPRARAVDRATSTTSGCASARSTPSRRTRAVFSGVDAAIAGLMRQESARVHRRRDLERRRRRWTRCSARRTRSRTRRWRSTTGCPRPAAAASSRWPLDPTPARRRADAGRAHEPARQVEPDVAGAPRQVRARADPLPDPAAAAARPRDQAARAERDADDARAVRAALGRRRCSSLPPADGSHRPRLRELRRRRPVPRHRERPGRRRVGRDLRRPTSPGRSTARSSSGRSWRPATTRARASRRSGSATATAAPRPTADGCSMKALNDKFAGSRLPGAGPGRRARRDRRLPLPPLHAAGGVQ